LNWQKKESANLKIDTYMHTRIQRKKNKEIETEFQRNVGYHWAYQHMHNGTTGRTEKKKYPKNNG